MESKCALSNDELIAALQEWNSKLCDTGGRALTLRVPVDPNHDPDMLISEVCRRLAELVEAVRWEREFDEVLVWLVQTGRYPKDAAGREALFAEDVCARAAVDALVGEG